MSNGPSLIFLLIVAFYFIKKTVKLNSYNKNMPELNPKPSFVETDSCFPRSADGWITTNGLTG